MNRKRATVRQPFQTRAAGKASGWRAARQEQVDLAGCFAPTSAAIHECGELSGDGLIRIEGPYGAVGYSQ